MTNVAAPRIEVETDILKKTLTTKEIENAVFIAQQAISDNLNSRISAANEKLNELHNQKMELVNSIGFDELTVFLEKEERIYVKHDPMVKKLRGALEFFCTSRQKKIEPFYVKWLIKELVRTIRINLSSSSHFKNDLTTVVVEVRTEGLFNQEYYHEIRTPEFLLKALQQEKALKTEIQQLEALIRSLKEELQILPKTTDKLKAQILAQELSKSDRGNQIMKLTQRIIDSKIQQFVLEQK